MSQHFYSYIAFWGGLRYPPQNAEIKSYCLCFWAFACPVKYFPLLNFVNDKSIVNNKKKAIHPGRSLFHRGGYSIRFVRVRLPGVYRSSSKNITVKFR